MCIQWALFACLLSAVIPSESSGSRQQRRYYRDDASTMLADDAIHDEIESLHDVTSASSSRQRFVGGKPRNGLTSEKRTLRKELRQALRRKKNVDRVVAGNANRTGIDLKTTDRNLYNVIGEVRFIKNELLYIKHQGHVIWENVTDARRDHKRISNLLWRILGNVTLVLTTLERATRTVNEMHRHYLPLGQRLDSAIGSLLGMTDIATIRHDVNVELSRSKDEMLHSVEGIMDEVRGLRRTMLHMGQSLPDYQRNVLSEFIKIDHKISTGYQLIITNISDVNFKMHGQIRQTTAIERVVSEVSSSVHDLTEKTTNSWNILIILFDRIAEIGAAVFASKTQTYKDSIDARSRLNIIASKLDTLAFNVNGIRIVLDTIKAKLRAVRRAVWKRCEGHSNNGIAESPINGEYDYNEDGDDDDILSIYDENIGTDYIAGNGQELYDEMQWPGSFPSNGQPPSEIYPTTPYPSFNYPTTVHPQPFPPMTTHRPMHPSTYYPFPGGTWPPGPSATEGPWYPSNQQNGAHWPTGPGTSKPSTYPTFQPTTTTPFYYPTTPGFFPGHVTTMVPSHPYPYPHLPTESFQFPVAPTTFRPMWPHQEPSRPGVVDWPTESPLPQPSFMIGCGSYFTGMCACVCSCDCSCPALRPSEASIFANATSHNPHASVHLWNNECRCLCPCKCPAGTVVASRPQAPPFEAPPPPQSYLNGNGGPTGNGFDPLQTDNWNHHELLNEIIRANKLIRDDLANTRNFIKSEHEKTRQSNNIVAKNNLDYLIQHHGRYFEDAHKLLTDITETLRIWQMQMKQAMEKMAISFQTMAVNIMQFHQELDNSLRHGKRNQGKLPFDPPVIVPPNFEENYSIASEPWQTADNPFIPHRDDNFPSWINQSAIDAMSGRMSPGRPFSSGGPTRNDEADRIWQSRRSGGTIKNAGEGEKNGATECVGVDQYARDSPYKVGIASPVRYGGRTMSPKRSAMINPILDPFAFHNLLQQHIEKQVTNAIQMKPTNFGRKIRSSRWRKRDPYDLAYLPMLDGFPFISPPIIPRLPLPTVGIPDFSGISRSPTSYSTNVFREMSGGGASPTYSISYNNGKGTSWNVNFANGRTYSTWNPKNPGRWPRQRRGQSSLKR